MFRGYLSFQGGVCDSFGLKKKQCEVTSTIHLIHLDLRLFDAWKKFRNIFSQMVILQWFTMLESQKSPKKRIQVRGDYVGTSFC